MEVKYMNPLWIIGGIPLFFLLFPLSLLAIPVLGIYLAKRGRKREKNSGTGHSPEKPGYASPGGSQPPGEEVKEVQGAQKPRAPEKRRGDPHDPAYV